MYICTYKAIWRWRRFTIPYLGILPPTPAKICTSFFLCIILEEYDVTFCNLCQKSLNKKWEKLLLVVAFWMCIYMRSLLKHPTVLLAFCWNHNRKQSNCYTYICTCNMHVSFIFIPLSAEHSAVLLLFYFYLLYFYHSRWVR